MTEPRTYLRNTEPDFADFDVSIHDQLLPHDKVIMADSIRNEVWGWHDIEGVERLGLQSGATVRIWPRGEAFKGSSVSAPAPVTEPPAPSPQEAAGEPDNDPAEGE